MRLDVRRIGKVKDNQEVIGNRTRVKVVKNKMAPPFRVAEFDIRFGVGICSLGELLDLAIGQNIVQKSGAWFSFQEERIGQGREKTIARLTSDPDLSAQIAEKLCDSPQKAEPQTAPHKPEKEQAA